MKMKETYLNSILPIFTFDSTGKKMKRSKVIVSSSSTSSTSTSTTSIILLKTPWIAIFALTCWNVVKLHSDALLPNLINANNIQSLSSPTTVIVPSSASLWAQQQQQRQSSTSSILYQIWDEIGTYNDSYTFPPPRFLTNYHTRRIPTANDDHTTATINNNNNNNNNDVEASLHISADPAKLENLKTCLEYWGGPASVAIYISSKENIDAFETFLAKYKDSPYLAKANIHVALEQSTSSSSNIKLNYPHNMLRNLAMDHVVSDFLVALDVDLIPSRDTYPYIKSLLQQQQEQQSSINNTIISSVSIENDGHSSDINAVAASSERRSVLEMLKNRHLFVLPAFEVFSKNDRHHSFKKMIPKDTNDLLTMVRGKHPFAQADGFHIKDVKTAQEPTNYTRWLSEAVRAMAEAVGNDKKENHDKITAVGEDESTNHSISNKEGNENNNHVSNGSNNHLHHHQHQEEEQRQLGYYYYPIQYQSEYEPYVLAYKPGLPKYWESFRGFYFNKASWFMELDRAGYQFNVLSPRTNCYVIHLNHPPANTKKFNVYLENAKKLEKFSNYLNGRYPTTTTATRS